MSKYIWKYGLDVAASVQFFAVPEGSQFMATGLDGQGHPSVWIIADPDVPAPVDNADHLRAVILPNGGDMDALPDPDLAGHLGTFADTDGFVWHVFVLPSVNEAAHLHEAALRREAMMAELRGRLVPLQPTENAENAVTNEA